MSDDAQKETKEIAIGIDKACTIMYPLSWKALSNRTFDIGEG
jgi:hypothetical protein